MAPDRMAMLLLGGVFLLIGCEETGTRSPASPPSLSPELRAWNADHITKGRALFACFRAEYDRLEDRVSPPNVIAQAMNDACDEERTILKETYLRLPDVDMSIRREKMRAEDPYRIANALLMVTRKRDGTYIEGVELPIE